MTVRASLNDAIALRGPSGSSRGTGLIARALAEMDVEVERLSPPGPRKSKLGNALKATAWDMRLFDRRASGDVLISPTNVGLVRRGRPHLLWVHDTMVLDHPGWFDRAYATHAKMTFGPSVRRATAVVTPSQDARRRLVRRWPSIASRVHVIPWPTTDAALPARAAVPASLTVIMLGATEPHKRHVLGVEAVRLLRLVTGADVRLLIVGPAGRAEAGLVQRLGIVDPDGCWTQRRSFPDRAGVEQALSQSWLLLQCSSDEGFCLPLVEAAQWAVPAVHTGAGSMAEVHPPGNCHSAEPRILAQRMADMLDDAAYSRASADAVAVALRHSWSGFKHDLQAVLGGISPCA